MSAVRPLRISLIAVLSALRRDAGIGQDLGRVGALLEGQRQQQPLGRHVLVAGLLGDLFGGIEHAGELGGHVELAGAAARNLRALGECRFDGVERRLGVAARLADQSRGEPSLSSSSTFSRWSGENC